MLQNIFSSSAIKGEYLESLAKECVDSYVKNRHPEKTIVNLNNFLLNRFCPWTNNRELTAGLLQDYANHMLEKGLAISSINSDIGRLKMFASWLYHEKKLTDRNLGKDIKRPKLRVPEAEQEELISAEKMEEYINIACRPKNMRSGKLGEKDRYINREYREFLHFLRKTGLRPGEAINIKPEHINLDGDPPYFKVWRSKGGRGGKWVKLGLPLDYLDEVRERVERGYWFEVGRVGLQKKMKEISRLSGKKLNLYSIRKSVDTGMLDNDANVMKAAIHQGHTVGVMQQYYVKFSSKQSSEVLNTYNPHIDRSKVDVKHTTGQIESKLKEWELHPDVIVETKTIGRARKKQRVYTVRVNL